MRIVRGIVSSDQTRHDQTRDQTLVKLWNTLFAHAVDCMRFPRAQDARWARRACCGAVQRLASATWGVEFALAVLTREQLTLDLSSGVDERRTLLPLVLLVRVAFGRREQPSNRTQHNLDQS